MNTMSKYFKPSVVALSPYTSARDEYEGEEGIFLDANENPIIDRYNRYPDPYQSVLKKEIGLWRNVDSSSIFLGNGSDEIIDLLIKSTCRAGKDRILSLDPSYGMYSVSSNINEVSLDLVPLTSDLTINPNSILEYIKNNHKLIFICSPNNPNGGVINPSIIEKILSQSNGLVVVDEAYIDFAETSSWISQLDNHKNLIVLQTFSKSMGAAAIRIGMGFMNKELVYFLNKIKPPYNISLPNQEVALSRLQNVHVLNKSISILKIEREWLRARLNELEIVQFIFPSEANFLLIRFLSSSFVFTQLKKQKIIVRDRSKLMHCEGCIRISIGSPSENQKLVMALEVINSSLKLGK